MDETRNASAPSHASHEDALPETRTPELEAAIKAAGVWVNQLARTLKTCRLYDANNPTVIRFRDDLAAALRKHLAEHGPLTLRFASDDVLCEEESLYPARSRDDNLALIFHRDGVRSLGFRPGVENREVDALLDSVLQVSGQNLGQDDLVTLLWEANLMHVDIDYVPAEGGMGSGTAVEGEMVPWPVQDGGGVTDDSGVTGVESPAVIEEAPVADAPTRSDDWSTGELTVEIEAGFEELEFLSRSEVDRFIAEYRAEHEVPLVTAVIAIAHAYLGAGARDEDRGDLGRFAPRVVRQCVSQGAWLEAREALRLVRACGESEEFSIDAFAQELLQPISVSGTVEHLDQQDSAGILDFIGFARELGDPAVDWLNLVLAESQQRRTRRHLAEAIANLCRETPERLAPWLSDPRWYVVRNVVHILGWIGGNAIVGLLQSALRHPDPRVKQEVVAALGQVDTRLARPLLVRLLDGADTRMFCAVMHQLASARDASTARLVLGYLLDPEFEQRPTEERRAVYSTLGACGGDEVVADLEAELHKGNWFTRNPEPHRQSIARVLARIGTPLARMVLDRGSQSRRGPVKIACDLANQGGLQPGE
jgi:HEAT repeat protein